MAQLSEKDIEILDLLVDEGFEPYGLEGQQQERADQMTALLSLLEPEECVSGSELLIQRTLEAAKEERQKQFKMDTPADVLRIESSCGGFRWRDMAGVAAIIAVCLTVGFPALNNAKLRAKQKAGQSNLSQIATGMTMYASENADQMPMAPHRMAESWWSVHHNSEDQIASNSAHLFHLTKAGYVHPKAFNDPGNPHGHDEPDLNAVDWTDPRHVSYSYQNQFDGQPDLLENGPRRPVVADKNPHFESGRQVKRDIDTDSRNHGRLGGQNVLYSDGSVRWQKEPVTESVDHIYLRGNPSKHVPTYSGDELPKDENDVFLVW